MEQLTIDTGLREYAVNGGPEHGGGVLRFNPSDPNVYSRFCALQNQLQELEQQVQAQSPTGTDAIQLLAQADQRAKGLLAEVFGAMDIPYFIDAKKPLLFHPLFELVRAALECWAYHPKYEHILRFVKNPLLPISREQADLLDNYALAHGLRFWHFQSEAAWDFSVN